MDSALNDVVNLFANGFKVMVYVRICKAKNLQIVLLKNLVTLCIISFALFGIVLGTIQFDNKSGLCAIKIYNKGFYNSLFIYFYGICTEKCIPELVLLWRQIASERSCGAKHFVIFIYG